jgi:hypothetical protein
MVIINNLYGAFVPCWASIPREILKRASRVFEHATGPSRRRRIWLPWQLPTPYPIRFPSAERLKIVCKTVSSWKPHID